MSHKELVERAIAAMSGGPNGITDDEAVFLRTCFTEALVRARSPDPSRWREFDLTVQRFRQRPTYDTLDSLKRCGFALLNTELEAVRKAL